MGFGHRLLTLLDALVHEFLNVTAIHTQDVVVMVTRVELEHGHTIGEMMPCHESGRLKLGQHAINRRKANVFAQIHQPAVNVLGRQVPRAHQPRDPSARGAHGASRLRRVAQRILKTRDAGHKVVVVVSAMGAAVLLAAYVLGIVLGRKSPLVFAREMIPAQAVAISTQSSLASLPAMLASARRMGVRDSTAEFVLPLAVAIFRATSPAMNMAVAIYVAHLAGVTLTPVALIAGVAVALIISVGSVSLPGSISFVVSIGPIALAMGVPVEPLAILVAVEMLPDIMRTLGNVTMNVAVAASVDRIKPDDASVPT